MGTVEMPMTTPSNRTAMDEMYGRALPAVLSIQVTLAALGFLVNSILLVGELKTKNWPFFQRLLFTNVTTAATISCLMHCVQGSVQIHQIMCGNGGTLEGYLFWSDKVADTAQTTIAINMATLAFQNYVALYHCDKQISSPTTKEMNKKAKMVMVSVMIICVWLVACGFVAGDLNPQAQIYEGEEKSNTSTYISFVVGMCIEFSVICVIYATRRMLRKLQTDFEVHRAQQSLNARVHIKATIGITGTISRVLLFHMIVWVITILTGFGINRYLKSTNVYDDSQTSALTAVIDSMVMSFDVVCPFVVTWKQPQLQRHMGLTKLCQLVRGSEVAPEPPVLVLSSTEVKCARETATATKITAAGHAHFDAINNLWGRVANEKFAKSSQSTSGIKVNRSISNMKV